MTEQPLRLRPGVYSAPADGGVYFLTYDGPVFIRGSSVETWFSRLAPFLDGRAGLAELTRALSPDRAAFVARLLTMLHERGILQSAPAPDEHQLSDEERVTFAHEITQLGYFVGDPVAAFARFRAADLVVAGAEQLTRPLVDAAALAGSRRVRTIDPAGTDLVDALAGADLVVLVARHVPDGLAGRLERRCREIGAGLSYAVSGPEGVWLLPMRRPDADHPGWTGAWLRRVSDTVGPGTAATLPPIAASQIVRDVFLWSTGARGPSPTHLMVRIDPDVPGREEHRFVPHPFAAAATADQADTVVGTVRARQDRPALAVEEFSQRSAALIDDRFGVVHGLAEGDLPQSPLHVAQAVVSDPMRLHGGPATVIGAGLDFETARYQAMLRALAAYGSLAVDPRRLTDEGGDPLVPAATDPWSVLSQLRTGDRSGYVPAVDLVHGGPRRVRAEEVFPALVAGAAAPGPPVGTGVGYRWSEALEHGLLDQCRALSIVDTGPSPAIDLDHVRLDELGRYCWSMLRAAGVPFSLRDGTGALGVPTVLGELAGRPGGVDCGSTSEMAVSLALRRLLLRFQLGGLPEVEARAGTDAQVFAGPVAGESALTTRDIVDRLGQHGYRPAVVPLDHDRDVARVVPFVLRVVLCVD